MTDFLLSPAARADLDEIWDYTASRWSVDQAERYIRAIVEACQEIAAGPEIIRVLHQRMDVGARLH